jgi:predicted tellurium resistance membrane protein TerC
MNVGSISGIAFSLLALTFLEIILGVDNLIFLTVISAKLPTEKQKIARRLGLIFALVTRLLLLASAVWVVHFKKPLFSIFNLPLSFRDLLLMGGGLFLLTKATQEIHQQLSSQMNPPSFQPKKCLENLSIESTAFKKKTTPPKVFAPIFFVAIQIGLLDIVFSLDSVFTAIGLTNAYWIMSTAIFIAILTMIFLSEPLSRLIYHHPTIKMLALSFLLLVGVILIADGFHFHIPRGYIYFAICFSVLVEILNTLVKRKHR